MDIVELYLATLFTFLIPICTFIMLYIGTFDFSKSFSGVLITKKEFYLLFFGSLLGMLGNIPVIVYGETFLGVNVGGAVIPIILSVYFFKKKFSLDTREMLLLSGIIASLSVVYTLILNANLMQWSMKVYPYRFYIVAGIFVTSAIIGFTYYHARKRDVCLYGIAAFEVVAFLTYAVTQYVPELGIASEFPYYLIPSVGGALISLIIFRGKAEGLLFGYSTTTFGVLVGADIFHLPEIYHTSKVFAGAIGGAATMDMVFLGGLITLLLLLPFTGKKFWHYSPAFSRYSRVDSTVRNLMTEAWVLYQSAKYNLALEKAIQAIDVFYKLVARDNKSVSDFLRERGKLYALYDYNVLLSEARRADLNQYDAYRALNAAHFILGEIERCRQMTYADIYSRVVAYLIDIVISVLIILPFAIVAGVFIYKNPQELNEIILIGFSSLVGAVCFLYFTVLEYFTGRTIGKRVMHIKVMELYGGKIGVSAAMMRNLTRFIALTILSYSITFVIMPDLIYQATGAALGFVFLIASGFSIIFIARSKHAQRLGDLLGDTVVVKDNPCAE
jgi:uncharacterized membrane protein/uncharacterized RDD family membrane protein YckC